MNENRLPDLEEDYTLNQDIIKLKDLDNLLKCGICYEYFDTCVVTECSHNFCSLCIRKYIQFKTECPVCLHELYDSQLRANRIIDNFVGSFPNLKDRLIRQLRTMKAMKSNSVYVSPSKMLDSASPRNHSSLSKKCVENSTKRNESQNTDSCSTSADSNSYEKADRTPEFSKIVIPKMFLSPIKQSSSTFEHSKRTFVSCPVCQVEIPESSINLHLDNCLNRDEDEKRKKQDPAIKRKHLPKLVYQLMSINELRLKLKQHGLNSHGDFEVLKTRLQKYTALYNAECDKINPRPVPDIIRQLEKEEKILSSQKSSKSATINVFRDDATAKEKQNEQYLKENKDSFQLLISNIQSRSKINDPKNISADDKFPSKKSPTLKRDCRPSTSKFNHEEDPVNCEQNSKCRNTRHPNANEIKTESGCNFKDELVENTVGCKKNTEDWLQEEKLDISEIKVELVCNTKPDPDGDYLNGVSVNSTEEVLFKSEKLCRGSKRCLFNCDKTGKKSNDEERINHSDHPSLDAEHHEAGIDAIDLCDVNLDEITTSPVIYKRNMKKRKCTEEETSRRNLSRRKK